MPIPNEALLVSFLGWLDAGPRPYAEMLEAWRTSCPRLTVWEDALELEFVCRRGREGQEPTLELTDIGRAWLRERSRVAGVEA